MRHIFAAMVALFVSAACDDTPPITVVENPADAGCAGPEEPRRYQVFFALDVSGSMAPFLKDVRDELEGLVAGFPDVDTLGRGVRVDYYVVGFVNDYKSFGGRMSTLLAVQAALDEAIAAGANHTNITTNTPNVEEEENLLDALAQIPSLAAANDAVTLVLIATDADFVETPDVLSPSTQVVASYADVRASLAALDARVHVFSRANTPGLTIPFKNQAPLVDLPGSSAASLNELTGARDRVRSKLNDIAQGARCDVQRTP